MSPAFGFLRSGAHSAIHSRKELDMPPTDVATPNDAAGNAPVRGQEPAGIQSFRESFFGRIGNSVSRGVGSVGDGISRGVGAVGDAAVSAGREVGDFVRSDGARDALNTARQGVATGIDAVGGNSGNATIDRITNTVGEIPGVGNVVGGARTLTDSGVTGVIRDGQGQIDTQVLVEGVINNAPVSGDLARAREIADRTGVTERVVDAVAGQTTATGNSEIVASSSVPGLPTVDIVTTPQPQRDSFFTRVARSIGNAFTGDNRHESAAGGTGAGTGAGGGDGGGGGGSGSGTSTVIVIGEEVEEDTAQKKSGN